MFDELEKYSNNDHFFFTPKDDLEIVCNAPKNRSGIYILYELTNGQVELVYIGSSGKVLKDGSIKHRKGGLYDRIVNSKQFEDIQRKRSWKQKIIHEKIDALDVYWYDTFNDETNDIPVYVEATIIQRYFEVHGRLPKWNIEI